MGITKEVIIIFKTHLDIGFTDYAENIVNKYINVYIPNAIKVGYELKDTEYPFKWTVGSWLINSALEKDTTGIVEQAIKDGILCWHALPFTTHTEAMNVRLFEYGINISKELDKRFGKKTVGAKMSDVPGHTIGMVPLLKKNGINFLHIGVNPATPMPKIPPVFKWRLGNDEITVMYQADYGEVAEFEDFVVYFAHTGDNLGPQSAQQIIDVYKNVRQKYPDCILKAGTIDDVAERVGHLSGIPIVEKEIGDSWIHGIGTDPQKLSRYRKLLRHINTLSEIPLDLRYNLLCVPEHTWGMDLKTYFPYDKFYSHKEMELLRNERKKIEKSWEEQRNYVKTAETLLGIESDYSVKKPDFSEYNETEMPADIDYEISWQIFDNSDYERYQRDYMRCHVRWAMWDFTKMGLPQYTGGICTARVTNAYKSGEKKLFKLEFDKNATEKYGLPYFYLEELGEAVTITWFGKKCSRFPQACWFKIKGLYEDWKIQKMGKWISPDEIIGSPLICGIDESVKNPYLTVKSLDCGLVAPFGRRLLQYTSEPYKQDMYFNLYNNIWNTNFPMWYDDDAMFRFVLVPEAE
jgi:hypothetical protein